MKILSHLDLADLFFQVVCLGSTFLAASSWHNCDAVKTVADIGVRSNRRF